MKSMIKNLLLLTMVFSVYSCNEKISAELESGSSTTVPPVIVPSQYYFKVTNQSPAVLNYVLHRTGAGNGSKECSITSNGLPFSNDLYIGESTAPHDSKVLDISCFMEAEELSLQFNGLDFNIEASPNTCEYISYAPYSYLDNIPGSSSASYVAYECTQDAQASGLPTAPFSPASDQNGPIPCGTMVDTSLPPASRVARAIPTEKQDLCAYDYSEFTNDGDGDKNCDIGKINFTTRTVILNPAVPGVAAIPDDPMTPADESVPAVAAIPAFLGIGSDGVASKHACGGKIKACTQGAFKQEPTLADSDTLSSIIYGTVQNQAFVQKYELPALLGLKAFNSDIVNYRRGLASLDLNYLDYTTGNHPNWADSSYNRAFDPNLMEKYAANRNPDGSYIIDIAGTPSSAVNATVSNAAWIAKVRENGWTQTPYAADPYLGYGAKARVNPFYTFYCLDRAQEIKARIRMVVRDWDRVYPAGTSDLELLSDVHKSIGARRLDLPTDEEEVPGDPANNNYFDDIWDWDVRVAMTRADPNGIGVYDPGDTKWSPTAGWWDPWIFPGEGDPGSEASED